MFRSSKSGVRLGIFSLVLCINMASGVEVEVTQTANWIWFKDGSPAQEKPTQTFQGKMEQANETDGKVKLDGGKYYTPNLDFIDTITIGNTANGLASLATNKSFGIGTLTMKGNSTLNVGGAYVDNNCKNSDSCGLFNVRHLILDTTKDKIQYVKFVDAQKTTIKGEGTVNFNKAKNLPNNANLGDVTVSSGAKTTITSTDTDAKTTMSSLRIESGAEVKIGENNNNKELKGNIDITKLEVDKNGKLDVQNGDKDKLKVGTLDVKSGATITAETGKMTVDSVIAEAGVSGLDKILTNGTKFTLTAIKSGSIADFLSDKSTSTKLGSTLPSGYKDGATDKHNVVDDGLFKYSGDWRQVVAKENGGTDYIANTQTINLNVAPSDRFQASLDNAYLVHHILVSDTLAINNKLFLFDSFKSDSEIERESRAKQIKESAKNAKNTKNANAQSVESTTNEVAQNVDAWVDYEYSNVSKYGNALDANTHSAQVGVGFLQMNQIKVGGFFRYTYLGADNGGIGNAYSAHAYNAGFYGAANVWANGYLRGQLAYTGINLTGKYTLRNDKAGTEIGGALKDGYHYLTTSIGVAQEGVISNVFWGSVAVDVAHIVPLVGMSQFDKYDFSKNAVTMANLSGAMGIKIHDAMLYAKGQVGYVISSRDKEIDLSERAKSDFYAGGAGGTTTAQNSQWQQNFGVINDYKYNMIVGEIGIGATYNFTKAFKGALYLGAGFYSESKPNFKMSFGLDYLF